MAINTRGIGQTIAQGSQNFLNNVRSINKEKRLNILQDAAEERRKRQEERAEQDELRQEELHQAKLAVLDNQNKSMLYQQEQRKIASDKQAYAADLTKRVGDAVRANKGDNKRSYFEIVDEELDRNYGVPGSPDLQTQQKYKLANDMAFIKDTQAKYANNPQGFVEALNNSWYGKKRGKFVFTPEGINIIDAKTGQKKFISKEELLANKQNLSTQKAQQDILIKQQKIKESQARTNFYNAKANNIGVGTTSVKTNATRKSKSTTTNNSIKTDKRIKDLNAELTKNSDEFNKIDTMISTGKVFGKDTLLPGTEAWGYLTKEQKQAELVKNARKTKQLNKQLNAIKTRNREIENNLGIQRYTKKTLISDVKSGKLSKERAKEIAIKRGWQ